MSPLDKLERRFGRYGVPYVTQAIILVQFLAFAISFQRPEILEPIYLIPSRVLQGEPWRLVTFLAIPPQMSPIFILFFFYLFFLMGTALENHWGAFRYNIFLLIGYIATVAVSFLQPDGYTTGAYVQGSVYLAFAYLFPDFQLYIFFIIPVKIKYLALITWIGYFFGIVFGESQTRLLILASICNFLLFFGMDIVQRARTGRRHMAFQAKTYSRPLEEPFHRCVVCGITDMTHPDMDFRYCPECAGTPGYCSEHLATHEHLKAEAVQ